MFNTFYPPLVANYVISLWPEFYGAWAAKSTNSPWWVDHEVETGHNAGQ